LDRRGKEAGVPVRVGFVDEDTLLWLEAALAKGAGRRRRRA
jgi:hypothetical protein